MDLDAEVDTDGRADGHADEGDPPLLIELNDVQDAAQDALGAELVDMRLRKVPITIVTGLNPRQPTQWLSHRGPTDNEGRV